LEKVANKIEYSVSRVLLLPIIDQDPSNLQTIYTALHFAANHAKQIQMNTCFVTFDYALWIKAKQILCNTQDEDLKNVQLRLGGFHLTMSYFKAVGTIMGGSGIKELFATVFATNSVDKILNCTTYSRAVRAHILAATAIGELIAN
ncbi:GSCOCG00009898001-RA-CDS, partial [Cotesia congregata]